MTSGPIPAGSPIVIPKSGLSFDLVMFFLTFIPFADHSLHRMLKNTSLLTRPTPARQDGLFRGQGRSELSL